MYHMILYHMVYVPGLAVGDVHCSEGIILLTDTVSLTDATNSIDAYLVWGRVPISEMNYNTIS